LILDAEKFAIARSWADGYGLAYEQWDPRQLQLAEPELAMMPQGGLVFPQIAQVRNPRFLKSVIHSCRTHGVELVENCPVLGLSEQGSRVTGVRLAEGEVRADRVVLCAGAWTGTVLAEQGISMPIRPVRGQMLLYRATPGWVSHIILYQGRYIIPRRDGRILVGSTMEEVGFDQQTTEEARQAIGDFAEHCLPGISQFELERHWSGLRPGSPQGIPYICEVPGRRGLFLNAGHFRNGVILGPASARLLADLVLERNPILEPAAYGCASSEQIPSKVL
jgi:glycine oxidase